MRALLASGLLGHPEAKSSWRLPRIVWNGFMVAPRHAVRQIESLMPGELRVYDARGAEEGSTCILDVGLTFAGPTVRR